MIFFRRFYVKNLLAETDACAESHRKSDEAETPASRCLVAAACVYVAAKSEEAPIHVKTVVEASRAIFGGTTFPEL